MNSYRPFSLSFSLSLPLFLLSSSSPWCGSHYAESILGLDTVQGNIPAGGFWCSSLPTIEPEISTTPFTPTYPKRKAAVARLTKYSDVDGRYTCRAPRYGAVRESSLCMNHRKSSVGLCSRSLVPSISTVNPCSNLSFPTFSFSAQLKVTLLVETPVPSFLPSSMKCVLSFIHLSSVFHFLFLFFFFFFESDVLLFFFFLFM